MNTNVPYTTNDLIACVRKSLSVSDGEPRLTPIRSGKFNDSYFVSTSRGEYVLRVAPDPNTGFLFYERDMMRQEPEIHRLLRERTGVPAPAILAFDDSRSIIERDYLIMERAPGRPLSEHPDCDEGAVLREVGEALGQAHCLTAKQYGYLGPHRPMTPQPTWRKAFRIMWNKLLDDIVACGHYTQQEADGLRKLFEEFKGAFDYDGPPRLLHMDVWDQNILVCDDGMLSGLIDWDRALWGDPEIEFAVLDYCGVFTPEFWEGYGDWNLDYTEARIRYIFYFLYELQKYIVIRQARQGNREGALAYKRQTMRILREHLEYPDSF